MKKKIRLKQGAAPLGWGRGAGKRQGRQEGYQKESSSVFLLNDRRYIEVANPLPCSCGDRLPLTKHTPRDRSSLIALALLIAHPFLLARLAPLPVTLSLPSPTLLHACLHLCPIPLLRFLPLLSIMSHMAILSPLVSCFPHSASPPC